MRNTSDVSLNRSNVFEFYILFGLRCVRPHFHLPSNQNAFVCDSVMTLIVNGMVCAKYLYFYEAQHVARFQTNFDRTRWKSTTSRGMLYVWHTENELHATSWYLIYYFIHLKKNVNEEELTFFFFVSVTASFTQFLLILLFYSLKVIFLVNSVVCCGRPSIRISGFFFWYTFYYKLRRKCFLFVQDHSSYRVCFVGDLNVW